MMSSITSESISESKIFKIIKILDNMFSKTITVNYYTEYRLNQLNSKL